MVDVLFEVARERGDDLDAVRGQEFGKIFEAGFVKDGEVVAVDAAEIQFRGEFDEGAEVGVEFGCAAGDVDDGWAMFANPARNAGGDLAAHHFGAPGGGVDVAMAAGLVAFSAEVQLQRLESRAAKLESP